MFIFVRVFMNQSISLKDSLLERLRSGGALSGWDQVRLVFTLSLPAILAQISSILMQYIDAAMVGHLGAGPSASIGLVSTTTWILGGFCMATSSGFTVQVAHLVGAKQFSKAREVMRQAFTVVLLFSLCLGLVGVAIAPGLPHWLGGEEAICDDASAYFLIYSAFLPFMQFTFTAGAMLQATGEMRVPALLQVMMCVLDVAFNYLFIYVLDMGVRGAAFGTALAEVVTAVPMLGWLLLKSEHLNLRQDGRTGLRVFRPKKDTLKVAAGISAPMWLQNLITRGAYVCSTLIVAPLGMVSIAANSFAITAESFCYMPGYGMEEAATTLVGQSVGARRKDMARRFALIATGLGAALVSFLAVLMYIFAPQMMQLLTNEPEVIDLGVRCLRIEAFAETFYAVSMVAYGACVGAGDTLVPSVINFGSMWIVRIGLALLLVPHFGLIGYWIAMCVELNVRGIIFLCRILGKRWLKKDIVTT